MGQKVSPHGLRVGIISDWDSKWYAGKKDFADYLIEDNKIRAFIKKKLYAAGISKTVIERKADNQIKISVMTDKPGIIIGRSGGGADEIKAALEKLTKKQVRLNIVEVKRAELDAQLTAESIAQALEKRISFRRAMKSAIGRTMRANAKGIKVCVAGRLGGAEIARSEKYSEGNVPLHTLRAIIDYGFAEADTQYGKIGVKVWINHGERLEKSLMSQVPEDKAGGRGERGERGDRRDRRDRRDGDRDRGDRPRRDGGGGRDGGRGGRDGRRDGRGGRDSGPEPQRAVNPRKRLTPKKDPAPKPAPEPEALETQVEEAPATEEVATEE
ncbi:MAG: 30S ribosomal protein S3 [Clostridiales Family XIII bacterium]|jgi:small subunit ribosomal protein S3|nr:30S ribosomal protein S3 [Clostridiales Family XIII bacterium]